MAKDWIEKNIPSGSHILIAKIQRLGEYIYLNENKESLNQKYLRYKPIIDTIPSYHGNALTELKIKMKKIRDPSYYINYFFLPREWENPLRDDFRKEIMKVSVLSIDEYKKIGIDYIVVARWKPSHNYSTEQDMKKYPDFYYFFQSLEGECKLINTFKYHNSLVTSRNPLINPEIKIYSLH
jgi:hypothetical protein